MPHPANPEPPTSTRVIHPPQSRNFQAQSPAAASAKRLTELTEVIDCLRSLAVDGVMPAQTLYDERKPAHLLPSKLLGGRFGVLWQELAEQAGLRYNGRGPVLTGKRK